MISCAVPWAPGRHPPWRLPVYKKVYGSCQGVGVFRGTLGRWFQGTTPGEQKVNNRRSRHSSLPEEAVALPRIHGYAVTLYDSSS